MTNTFHHGFILIEEGDTQIQTKINDMMAKVDRWLGRGVKSRTTDAQPGSPAEGDAYIMTAGHTGAQWTGFTTNYLAVFLDGAWLQYPPVGRVDVFVDNEGKNYYWTGSAWATASGLVAADIDTLAELNAIITDADLASQAYVATQVAGLFDYKGGYNASTNSPDLDTSPSGVLKGDTYTVTADGVFFTEQVRVGDVLVAEVDNPTALADWTTLQGNIDPQEIFTVDVETVANIDYVMWYDAPFAGTITLVRTESVSGTCTLTGKVNTTALGGTANSVSSTAQEQAHSSSNTFVKGDKIQFTISSNSACLNMAVAFYIRRTS